MLIVSVPPEAFGACRSAQDESQYIYSSISGHVCVRLAVQSERRCECMGVMAHSQAQECGVMGLISLLRPPPSNSRIPDGLQNILCI